MNEYSLFNSIMLICFEELNAFFSRYWTKNVSNSVKNSNTIKKSVRHVKIRLT